MWTQSYQIIIIDETQHVLASLCSVGRSASLRINGSIVSEGGSSC
jgi:hypothetical protein